MVGRSIDDLVAGLHKAVADAGLLDSTYFLFSSDHGYHLGQFRIPIEKMLPYVPGAPTSCGSLTLCDACGPYSCTSPPLESHGTAARHPMRWVRDGPRR